MLTQEEIRRRAERFDRWHYQFDLQGVLTPIWNPDCINRHCQRKGYFFDPLIALCGGSLSGKRVLDLGCNAGYWSLAAIEAGCDFVCGIDGRKMHIEQANLVFEANGVDRKRYNFLECDLLKTDMAKLGNFDVVLCLGLLYHVNRPIELLESIRRSNTDLLVIDTSLHPGDQPILHLQHDTLTDPRSAVESSLVFFPTVTAVIEMVRLFGYHGVVLRPDFDDYTGAEDFREGTRRAFLCARKTDLSPLTGQAETSF
jgi:tRNA (mo5U34)-methyltransferase